MDCINNDGSDSYNDASGYYCDHYDQNPDQCGDNNDSADSHCCACDGGVADYKRTFYAPDPKTVYAAFTFEAIEYFSYRYETLYAPQVNCIGDIIEYAESAREAWYLLFKYPWVLWSFNLVCE